MGYEEIISKQLVNSTKVSDAYVCVSKLSHSWFR